MISFHMIQSLDKPWFEQYNPHISIACSASCLRSPLETTILSNLSNSDFLKISEVPLAYLDWRDMFYSFCHPHDCAIGFGFGSVTVSGSCPHTSANLVITPPRLYSPIS